MGYKSVSYSEHQQESLINIADLRELDFTKTEDGNSPSGLVKNETIFLKNLSKPLFLSNERKFCRRGFLKEAGSLLTTPLLLVTAGPFFKSYKITVKSFD